MRRRPAFPRGFFAPLLLLLIFSETARGEEGAPSSVPTFTLSGYLEGYYQWNFGQPGNGITAFRGYDNRHNSLTLSNAVMSVQGELGPLSGILSLQTGSTGESYSLAEPSLAGGGGANASSSEVWKHIQQANGQIKVPGKAAVKVSGGVFLSPIGPEGIAVKDNWNGSRSQLFFALPAYHSGVRVQVPLNSSLALTGGVFNGWNNIVDNNPEKSFFVQAGYGPSDRFNLSFVFFTGVERSPDAPEGRAWRQTFDLHATFHATPWLSLLVHADGGFEPNAFGTSGWAAGAAYARVRFHSQVHLALRGEFFYEVVAENEEGRASPIFWPVPWVTAGTATLEVRPVDSLSLRLELRHDRAGGEIFFGGDVAGDGQATPFVANRSSQTTLTIGLTAWL